MFVWFFDVNHLVDSADDEGRIGFFYCNLILNLHGQSSHCCKLLHLLSIPNSQTDLKQKKSLELGALASLLALTSSTTGFFFFFFVIGQFHYLSFHLALKRNKLLNQSHNHTNAHMTTKKTSILQILVRSQIKTTFCCVIENLLNQIFLPRDS